MPPGKKVTARFLPAQNKLIVSKREPTDHQNRCPQQMSVLTSMAGQLPLNFTIISTHKAQF